MSVIEWIEQVEWLAVLGVLTIGGGWVDHTLRSLRDNTGEVITTQSVLIHDLVVGRDDADLPTTSTRGDGDGDHGV
jgi:hypothetical protein